MRGIFKDNHLSVWIKEILTDPHALNVIAQFPSILYFFQGRSQDTLKVFLLWYPPQWGPDDGSDRTLRNQPSPLHHKLLCPYFSCCSSGPISTGEKESPGHMQLPPLHGHPLLQLGLCHLPEVPVSFSCLWGAGCCCHVWPGHPHSQSFHL